MEEQTTIVGRPTYMAMFPGTQDADPIVAKLTSIGYPADDITVLLRPPGTDSAVDLLSEENAAGQDTDAARAIAGLGDKLKDACTIVILHPEPGQVEAVRAALTGMGGQEFGYEPQTVYTGAQSEAEFAQATVGSIGAGRNAGIEGAGATSTSGSAGKDESTKPGQFHPSPANATADAGAAPTADAASATTVSTPLSAVPNKAETSSPPPLPPTDDLKDEIRDLTNAVDHVREELEERD